MVIRHPPRLAFGSRVTRQTSKASVMGTMVNVVTFPAWMGMVMNPVTCEVESTLRAYPSTT